MIEVKLVQKIIDKNGDSKREVKSKKVIKKNKNYKSFINELSKAFSIPRNKYEIILKVVTEEEDEYPIKNQEDLDSYIKDAKEFMIILENNESVVEGEEDIKTNLDIDIEIKNIMDSIKIPKIDNINDDIGFSIDKYKNESNGNYEKKLKDFKKVFDSDVKNIVSQKSKILRTNINKLFLDTQEAHKKNLELIKELASTTSNKFDEIMKENKEKDNTIIELKKKLNLFESKKMIKFDKEEIKVLLSIKKANYFNIDDIEITNIGNKIFKSLFFEIDTNKSSKDLLFYENTSANNIRHKLSLDGPFSVGKLKNTVYFYIKYPKIGEYTIYINIKETKDGNILSSPLKITVNLIEDPIENLKRRKEIRRKEEIPKPKERQVEIQKPKEIQTEQNRNEIIVIKPDKEDIDYKGLNKKDVDDMLNELENEFQISQKFNKEQAICKIIEFNCEREKMIQWIQDSF